VPLTDPLVPFVTDLISAFLRSASSDRKNLISWMINNIVAAGSDWGLRAIFNEDLLERYLPNFEMDESLRGGTRLWDQVATVIGLTQGIFYLRSDKASSKRKITHFSNISQQ
jgi:hypothetical protein